MNIFNSVSNGISNSLDDVLGGLFSSPGKGVASITSTLGHGDRGNKFAIDIPWIFSGSDASKYKTLTTNLVKSTELPAAELQVTEIMHKGRKLPIRDTLNFNNIWEVTFYVDSLYDIKTMMEEWMFIVSKPTTVEQLNYDTTITIGKLNEVGKVATMYSMYNAFPIKVGEVTLNRENKGISELTVTFAFSYWDKLSNSGNYDITPTWGVPTANSPKEVNKSTDNILEKFNNLTDSVSETFSKLY